MENQFHDFDLQLKDLSPEVKEKALEIAATLVAEKGMDRSDAIKEAIDQAEDWFFDSEG
ncbi:hypothetical protein G7074_00855 [Pedobacter sp. HDW13]|uniref:hypothetical protein n=1 Tax=Pedobacter sp. HDW13 TaxID=2714940 RepID=UPI0014081D79|nr:hypothetical protein [Pedobacter sp. HDW13]QIL37960.1 hypothetical protein G7074_00855 [Pedobacter sp. HDW13]